ncbi:hypothetical protein AB0C07_35395 [Actinoplanes missouriensis]|uniref:WXG100 family type VII secretion target n=1 Tax=Actinoplanes missouriensis TaxID=1866 RepID=UPI0033C773B2
MTSPLVAPVTGSTTGITGLGLVEDAHQIVTGIQNGSWIDASLGGVGASLEALSLVLDPIGGLVSWGVGWLMEHVSVLKEALDNLAGNADEVAAHATTWQNVAAYTQAARADYAARLSADVSTWAGEAGDAYRAHAGDHLAALDGIGVAAGGIASAVEGTGLLVALVREIVRDLIADFVATLAVRLPQWLAAEGLTLGIATPFVAGQVSSLVAKWAHRIQHFIRGLLSSLRQLLPKTDGLQRILETLQGLLQKMMRKNAVEPGRMDASADPPAREGGASGGGGGGGGADAGPGGSGAMPPPGPPWRARDDIPGPARGKDLTYPHARHTLAGAKHGQIKSDNTLILPGYEDAVADDIRRIAAGEANWDDATGRYIINDRTYGVKATGTVFPGSGPGLVLLDRNEYAALTQIAKADGDVDSVHVFKHDPRFVSNPGAIAKAKEIYDGTYSE